MALVTSVRDTEEERGPSRKEVKGGGESLTRPPPAVMAERRAVVAAIVGVDRMYESLELAVGDEESDEVGKIRGPGSGERRIRTEEVMVTGGERVDK